MSRWEDDLDKSHKDFLNIVWPAIEGRIRGGDLYPVEAIASINELARLIDTHSGIDWIQICGNGTKSLRGIASRVQWDVDYRTFTIRTHRPSGAKTEYEKRSLEIKDGGGWLLPAITTQAYVSGGKLLSYGIIKTKSLYGHIDNRGGPDSYNPIQNTDGSSSFIAVPWGEIERSEIRVWSNDTQP